MIASSQQALNKANEFMSYYSQFVSSDFFDDEDEEDDYHSNNNSNNQIKNHHSFEEQIANKSISAISGFFNKLKNTFEETRKNVNSGNKKDHSFTSSNDHSSNGGDTNDQLKFKSAE